MNLFLLAIHNDQTRWIIAITFFSPFILVGIYLAYTNRHTTKWEAGIFPPQLRYSRDNLMEAYICLAALMIQKNRDDYSRKLLFINSYFNKYFPNEVYDFGESIKFSFEHPINTNTVAFWLKKHLKEPAKRTQVLYFLAGIASIDGIFTKKEQDLLNSMRTLLDLSERDLKAVLAQYSFETEEEYYKRVNSKSSSSSANNINSTARIELAFKILGLTSTASIQEIKSAYRKLAMVHHPDKFMNESPEQIALAHERFQKILDAYELLEKMKG